MTEIDTFTLSVKVVVAATGVSENCKPLFILK